MKALRLTAILNGRGLPVLSLASALAAASLAVSSAAGAHRSPSPRSNLTARLDAAVHNEVAKDSFRGSVLVARGSRVLLSRGYGEADLTRQIPDTPTTRFRVGSLTKSFSALGVLKLVAAGELHLNDRSAATSPAARRRGHGSRSPSC
jgi:CubicO group peptidase (beta-lactamase class C family)